MMHELEKKLINLGAIDTAIDTIKVDEWFQNVSIAFTTSIAGKVQCFFEQCFEVSLTHDLNYSKNIKVDGSKDYEYFMQDIEILESNERYTFKISAWPLNGQIICSKISITSSIEPIG